MISPLVTFLAVAMFSPGPNIIMLTTSGARFGAARTWPHLIGVVLGVGVIGGISGAGIGALLLAQPALTLTLQVAAAVWILWMAWGLFRGDGRRSGASGMLVHRPMRFVEAVLFQWVNPKIWAIALAASSGYTLGLPPVQDGARMALAFMGVNFFVCVFWTYFGATLARLLNSERAWFRFRMVMAALLAASAGLVFL